MEVKTEIWNKLVRDKVPDWIRSNGGEAETRILEDDAEYEREIKAKFSEEGTEVKDADKDHELEELGDMLTLIETRLEDNGWTWEQLRVQQLRKDQERGRFEKRIFLISTKGEPYGKAS